MGTRRRSKGATPEGQSFTRLLGPVVVAGFLVATADLPCAHAQPAAPLASRPLAATPPPPPDRQSPAPGPAAVDDPAGVFMSAADAALRRGRLHEAEELARARGPRDPDAQLVLGRVAARQGRTEDAERLFREAARERPFGDAALELGLLLQRVGRRPDAAPVLTRLLDTPAAGASAVDIARVARAAQVLGQYRVANALFKQAAAAAPDDPAIGTWWGELFLEKHNRAEATKSFEAAVKADPEYAPAYLGLARVRADDNPPAALAAAARAVALDATLGAAHLVRAGLALDDDRPDDARAAIDEALAVNASDVEAHAWLAALAWVDGNTAEFDRAVAATLALNPVYGEVYRLAGAQAARHYRFDDAVALTRRAVALDTDHSRAQAELGMHLLRTGDEPGARAALEIAFARDPFDAITFNLLSLLDTLDGFETVSEGDLVVRLHPDEAPVMRDLVVPFARNALATLSARYGFTPRGPILVEMFPRHDDFAVRTLGLPGMVGALGACFGRVVTLDSPNARPPGTFSWEATLWHELTHVITLQMSRQRVPRWVTEGVSVYEERRARPWWGRESEVAFVRALDAGEALPVRSLNAGFSNPRFIALAYQQASLVVEHIVERFGDAGLRRLLEAYGTGLEDEAAITQALGTDVDGLQRSFDAFLQTRYGALRNALAVPDDLADAMEGADLEALEQLAVRHADRVAVHVALGRARAASGDTAGALSAYDRAASLAPQLVGKDAPGAQVAVLAEKAGDIPRAMTALESLLGRDNTGLEAARELARLAQATSDGPRLVSAHARIAELQPFEAASQAALGRAALEAGDVEEGLRAFRRALAAGAEDAVAVRTDLAQALLAAGRPAEAKREVLAALETAPRFERGQELLLRLVDSADARRDRR